MPFKSEQQKKWMYSQKPEMAAEWQKETPKGKKLPKYAPKKKKKKKKSKAQYYSLMVRVANIEEMLAKKIKDENPTWTFDEIVTEIDRLADEFFKKQQKKKSESFVSNNFIKLSIRDGGKMIVAPHSMERVYSFVRGMQ